MNIQPFFIRRSTLLLLLAVAGLAACARPVRSTLDRAPSREQLAEFWVEPSPERDLYWGPWGKANAPSPDLIYTFKGTDQGGYSPKWDVKAPDGVEWSVKMGSEAQSEVTASRILWAVGYHQPPNYFLPQWRADAGKGVQTLGPGRFRPSLRALDSDGDWSWRENPFVDTPQYRGLLILLQILNSGDLKDDNNSVYHVSDGSGEGPRRIYVVRDVGSSLGEVGWRPRRNNIELFEKTPFITGLQDGRVRFVNSGRFSWLLERMRPADVKWICARLQRLTPRQWRDAFRAGGYDEPTTERYVRKIRQKIEEGLALPDVGR